MVHLLNKHLSNSPRCITLLKTKLTYLFPSSTLQLIYFSFHQNFRLVVGGAHIPAHMMASAGSQPPINQQ